MGQRCDPDLTPAGWEQAADAAARLGRSWDRVVSSPARRARQTATAFGLPVALDARLAERDFGEWEGRTWTDLWPAAPRFADADAYAAFTPPGGEPLAAVVGRVCAASRDLASGGRVLAVTHGGPLACVLAAVLGCSWGAALERVPARGAALALERADAVWTIVDPGC